MFRRYWIYNVPVNIKDDPAAFGQMFDGVITGFGTDREAYFRKARETNPNLKIHLYLTQHSVDAIPPYNRNQVAFKPDDYKSLPEDYFVHTPDGKRVMKGNDNSYAMIDFRNPDWQEFFYNRVREIISVNPDLWNSVWLDDLSDRFYVWQKGEVKTATFGDMSNPVDRARYNYASMIYLRHLGRELSDFGGLGGNLQGDDVAMYTKLAKALVTPGGLLVNEFSFLSDKGEYLSVGEWRKDLDKTAAGVALGYDVANTAQLDAKKIADSDPEELERLNFFLASHALAADENSVIVVGKDYSNAYPIPAKTLDKYRVLGKSLTLYHVDDDGIYCRPFEHGKLCVNPATHETWINEPVIVPPQPTPEYITIERYNALLSKFDALLQAEIKTPGA